MAYKEQMENLKVEISRQRKEEKEAKARKSSGWHVIQVFLQYERSDEQVRG